MADLNFATAWGGNMDPKLLAMYNKLEALAKVSGVEIKPNDPDVPNVFDGAYFRGEKK